MANLTAYYTTTNGVNTPTAGTRALFYNETNGQLSSKDEKGDVYNALGQIPTYANNAAAIAGGLVTGDLFKVEVEGRTFGVAVVVE